MITVTRIVSIKGVAKHPYVHQTLRAGALVMDVYLSIPISVKMAASHAIGKAVEAVTNPD